MGDIVTWHILAHIYLVLAIATVILWIVEAIVYRRRYTSTGSVSEQVPEPPSTSSGTAEGTLVAVVLCAVLKAAGSKYHAIQSDFDAKSVWRIPNPDAHRLS